MSKFYPQKKRPTQGQMRHQGSADRDLERGTAQESGMRHDGNQSLTSDDELPALDIIPPRRANSRDNLPGMSTFTSQRSMRSMVSEGNRSFDSLPFGDQSIDGSGRRENLTRRPKQFRRSCDSDDLESQPDDDPLYDDDSEVEEVSLNDEHQSHGEGDRNDSFVANEVTLGRGQSVVRGASFGSSWDSFAGKRVTQEARETTVTPRSSKPSSLSALRGHGDSISSFRSRSLSKHLSVSYRERDQMSATSFVSIAEGPDEEEDTEQNSDAGDSPYAPPPEQQPSLTPEPKKKSRMREGCIWFDDWMRRKLQWFYVVAALYVGPVCFALYAPQIWVTALFYTSIACVTFVNAWMCFEVFFSVFYTRRMRKLHHITRPELIGERRLGCIVCAYLPNELTVLIQTVRAISNTIHELPEGTTMDIVLSHNGGKKEQRISLLEDLRKIEIELPPNVMVHELNVLSSRSKAENVNAALGFFSELGKIRGKEFTQIAMYDADHQPIPQAWRYALETMQDQKASMVMGRCCVADGMKTIAIEFDILYSIGHAGGRCVRGFGFFGGSNGYWDAKVLTETGMDEGMLTEDVDSSFRAQSVGNFMTYDPTIVSYEESPPNFSGLFKQRLRWAQGWYEVTLRQITLPFRRAPGLTLWSRFCLFLLLPFREAYVYFSSFTVPIAVVYLTTRCGWGCVDYRLLAFAAFCLVVPIAMTIMAWNITHDRVLNVHYRMPTLTPSDYFKYILISYFYELFKIHLTVMGHIRQVLSLNKWVVTKRKSTTDRVAPTITASMVRRTVPEMLIRHSPFARSTRQMFTGTYDEKRPKQFEHCSTDVTPTLAGTATDGTRSTDGSGMRDDSSNDRSPPPHEPEKAVVRNRTSYDRNRLSKSPQTSQYQPTTKNPQSVGVTMISMTGEVTTMPGRPMPAQ